MTRLAVLESLSGLSQGRQTWLDWVSPCCLTRRRRRRRRRRQWVTVPLVCTGAGTPATVTVSAITPHPALSTTRVTQTSYRRCLRTLNLTKTRARRD